VSENLIIKRTTSADPDFQLLIKLLDHELWNELNEDMQTYDQYNKVPDLETVLILYAGDEPVACGCFKPFDNDTAEIKRMFVKKAYRGQGLSKQILQNLEQWALENGYCQAILETSIHFETAKKLYQTNGYQVIPNYPPYNGLSESICLRKQLAKKVTEKISG
jgi:GNAT superfamily N-acetyltransferase